MGLFFINEIFSPLESFRALVVYRYYMVNEIMLSTFLRPDIA